MWHPSTSRARSNPRRPQSTRSRRARLTSPELLEARTLLSTVELWSIGDGQTRHDGARHDPGDHGRSHTQKHYINGVAHEFIVDVAPTEVGPAGGDSRRDHHQLPVHHCTRSAADRP